MTISRDNALWLRFWQDKRTDFHQNTVNGLLTRFWPSLQPGLGSRVFVPLCGKSLDMIWLAKQGHEVIGVELSPVAVRAFFKENRLQPSRQRVGRCILWKAGRVSILCGDYFSLVSEDLGRIDIVYDRAALTALPEDIRKLYVAHLKLLSPECATVFLLTAEDEEETAVIKPLFSVDDEIFNLYSTDFDIKILHAESVNELDPASSDQPQETIVYKVYRLTDRCGASKSLDTEIL
jgi:thiopurine S-methyltransferase